MRSIPAAILAAWIGITVSIETAYGQGKITVARELVEQISKKFTKEVAEEGADRLATRLQPLLAKFGTEGSEAITRVGPRAVTLLEEAGEESVVVARMLARHGDDALWAVQNPARRSLIANLGDDAGVSLMRHGTIAENVLAQSGKPSVAALNRLSAQGGRRLAILAEDPSTRSLATNTDVLAIIGKYGDRAMDFVWRNKLALLTGTTLAAFVANPEPFLDGAIQVAEVASTQIAKPIAEEIGKRTEWTWVLIAATAVAGFLVWLKWPKDRTPVAPSKN
ncbi:MAG: hypothetical protein FJ308_00345 [Planctomycetes bacterium]|nr:hypothetical protein [Planctomycetota bacterium]